MAELVGNIPDDAVLQAQLDILYGQTPDITIKAHELPEESEPTVEKSGTLAEPVFDIGIPQAMGAVAAREYAKQAETARDAAIVAGETAKEELNGIVASADAALDQKITETGTLLDEKVATAAQRASEAASSAAAAAQKAAAAEQAMQGAQAAQAQAEQSAQKAAENTAMAKDFASGQPVTYSGTPVSIAYAGANRIASITAYGENAQGGTTEAPVALTGVDSVHVCGRNLLPLPYSQVSETKNGLNIAVNADGTITVSGTATAETYLNLNPIPASLYRLMGLTGIVPAQNYPVTKNGFTFFDMTIQPYGEFARVYIVITKGSVVNRTYRPYIIKSAEPLPYETYQGSVTPIPIPRPLRRVGDVKDKCVTRQKHEGAEKLVVTYNVGYIASYAGESITTAWISSTGALSTGAEVAYVLSSPETYATDPLDIDNAAGPLTVMTGGEVEVRMTELVGSRSPEIVAKMDKTVYAQVGNPSELDNDNFLHCVNQRNVSGTISTSGYFIDRWKLISGTVQITENGLVLNGTISQILENAAGTDVTASSSAGAASYDNSTKTFTLTATGQTITWAKLEKGSVATPYVPKGYGAELAECLRYFQRVHADWRIYPTLKDMLYRFSQSTLQVMRIKPTISAHGTPYTFGCTINALDAQPMAFTVETKITEQGQNAAAASMLGYFDLSADL